MPVAMPTQQHIEPLRFADAAQAAAAAVAVQQKLTGTTPVITTKQPQPQAKSPAVEVPKHYKPTKNPRALPDRLPTPGAGYAVFVGTLPADTTPAELEAIGKPFGVLLRAPLLLPKKGRDGLRCGFLTFGGIKAAQNCIDNLNGFILREGALPLSVRFSNSSADQVPNLPPKRTPFGSPQQTPTTPLLGKDGGSTSSSVGPSSFESAPPSPPQTHGSQATSSPQQQIPVLPPPPISAGMPTMQLQQQVLLPQQQMAAPMQSTQVGDRQGQVLQGLMMQQQQLIVQRQMLLAAQQQHNTAAVNAAAEIAMLNQQLGVLSPTQPLTPMMSPATHATSPVTFHTEPLVTPAVSPPLGSEEDEEDQVLFLNEDAADVPDLVDEEDIAPPELAPPELECPDSPPCTPPPSPPAERSVRDRGSPVPPAFPIAHRRV